jgi:hypothetical protein
LRAIDRVVRSAAAPGQVNVPDPAAIPAYARSPAYVVRRGERSCLAGSPAFVTMVGMKYLAEAARMDPSYAVGSADGAEGSFLIAGEDSGGVTTGYHLFDKDAIWAGLLILEMISVRKKSLLELWAELEDRLGSPWAYGRLDLDGPEESKQRLVEHFLSELPRTPDPRIAGLACEYIGGIPGDFAEIHLKGENGVEARLIVRASGTEPICRAYVESSSVVMLHEIERAVLDTMDELSADRVREASDPWELLEVLRVSHPMPRTIRSVRETIERLAGRWGRGVASELRERLEASLPTLDTRRRIAAEGWASAIA